MADIDLLTEKWTYRHPRQLLYFFRVLRWVQAIYVFDLIGINFYSQMSDHVSQEFAKSDTTKRSFRCVETQLVLPKNQEHTSQVMQML